jgi:hypothetical protein
VPAASEIASEAPRGFDWEGAGDEPRKRGGLFGRSKRTSQAPEVAADPLASSFAEAAPVSQPDSRAKVAQYALVFLVVIVIGFLSYKIADRLLNGAAAPAGDSGAQVVTPATESEAPADADAATGQPAAGASTGTSKKSTGTSSSKKAGSAASAGGTSATSGAAADANGTSGSDSGGKTLNDLTSDADKAVKATGDPSPDPFAHP